MQQLITAAHFVVTLALFVTMTSLIASADDFTRLEDFCVATNNPSNPMLCKDPSEVTADDFLFRGLNAPGKIKDLFRCTHNYVIPQTMPGLNTMGVSLVRSDFEVGGFIPIHIHQRGNEVFTVLEGTINVGFVSFNQSDNSAKLFSKVLSPGDVFLFPQGLLHFTMNVGETKAVSFTAYSSQNAGYTPTANTLFGTVPPISVDLLSKAFKLDAKIIEDLQSKF